MDSVASTGVEPLPYSAPSRGRRRGMRVLVWVVGIVVVMGMLSAVMLPSLCRPRETANIVKCQSNMKQIGLAIAMYAKDHGGQYPPSLSTILETEDVLPAVMTCPSSNATTARGDGKAAIAQVAAAEANTAGHEDCLSYVYAGRGLTTATASATAVVLYEPLDNHGERGTNVLFGDGHAEWVPKEAWLKIAAAGGVEVVKSLTPGA